MTLSLDKEQFEPQVFFTSSTAFIPLSEFSDPGVLKKYGVKPDPETLDILTTAASQKEVILPFHHVSRPYPGA